MLQIFQFSSLKSLVSADVMACFWEATLAQYQQLNILRLFPQDCIVLPGTTCLSVHDMVHLNNSECEYSYYMATYFAV